MGDNIEDVAVNDTDLNANNDLVTSGEVETSNVEDSVNSQASINLSFDLFQST